MNKEEWRDVVDYEGVYLVSNLGNISRIDFYNARPVKKNLSGSGYLNVCLSKDTRRMTHAVHRLVAVAFLPNPKNERCVNHKDEDKTNNCVDNLEWCSHAYNNNYGTVRMRNSQVQTNSPVLSKPVVQCTIDGLFIKNYPSIMQAFRETGINASNINGAAIGRQKTAGGFVWRYADGQK